MSDESDSQETAHHRLITEEHVKAALKADKGEEAELSSWTINDFTQKGDNFSTFVTSVKLCYCLNGQSNNTSYIIKLNQNASFEDFKPFIAALFVKEGGFYEKLAPVLNSELSAIGQKALRVPKWIYNGLEDGKELIFLEDLRLRGFKMYDRKKGMDGPHALLVVQELARFHAASVLLQEKYHDEDLADKYDFLKLDWHNYSEKAEELFVFMFGNQFDSATEMLHKIGGYDVAEKWLAEHKPISIDVFKRNIVRKTPFDVICHGDCWNNNVLFRYSIDEVPLEVMFVDLQLCRKASIGTDLNYLMYTSFTGDVRKANVEEFLTSYYNTFSQVIKASERAVAFTLQQLFQEYRDRHEYGLLFGVYSVGLIVRPSEDMPDFSAIKNKEDLQKMMTEWKEKSSIMLDSNPLFRPRFLSIFDEMIECGVIA